MNEQSSEQALREKLRVSIQEKAIQRKDQGVKIVSKEEGTESSWLLDFRALLLTPEFLDCAADVFWDTYENKYPFQVGGIETVGIALVAAIVMKGVQRGMPVNGFYIRKSRKYYGLQKLIEGTLNDDPIILIDDLVNSGTSFAKQVEILKAEGKQVSDAFAFVRYRKEALALDHNITLTALYTPEDIGLSFSHFEKPLPDHKAFSILWAVRGKSPNYFYRVPKSAPVIDAHNVYMGADDGVLYAFDQVTGKEVWKFKIYGLGSKGKTIFSSPALHNGLLYFGAYDGNFYALDAATGKKRWTYMDADWIGSSPVVAPDLNLVFIGLEYGLWKKQGGIVALDATTGEKKWEYIEMPSLTHASPAYSEKFNAVAIGSNNGVLYLFRATDGQLIGQFQAGAEIKAAPVFDEERGYIVFGAFDGKIYVLNVFDGSLVYSHQTEAAIYSIPLIFNGHAYVSSLDKKIYCIDLASLGLVWSLQTAGRIFASPMMAENMLYFGSNDGRFYEVDPSTGRNTAFFQTTERITNKAAYNSESKCFFVPTYANDLYCIKKDTLA